MPRTVYTDETLQLIRRLAGIGRPTQEIAETVGVSKRSLQVTCSKVKISLSRRQGEPEPDEPVRLFLSDECRGRLRAAAEERGLGFAELAAGLLETIARDELISAVIDG
jgi:hypothetical protein